MPKNAVQRLQKIDKDIKTVLSIYDIANSSKEKHDNAKTQKEQEGLHLSQINASRCWEKILLLDKLLEQTTQTPSPLLDSLKQIGTFMPSFEQCLPPPDPMVARKKFYTLKKPSSAPSSSSTLSTICESDYKWPQSSGSFKDTSEWVDSYRFQEDLDAFMTPSKTLMTANEILAQNNYPTGGKKGARNENSVFGPKIPYSSEKSGRKVDYNRRMTVKAEEELQKGEDILKAKGDSSHKRNSESPNKKNKSKTSHDNQKESSFSEHSPLTPKKMQKLEKPGRLDSKIKHKFRSRTKESIEKLEKGWNIGKAEEHTSSLKRDKNCSPDRHDKKSRSPSEKERKTQIPVTSNTQKIRKSPETNRAEFRANELSKIIEKSNEKLEKMKASKELALGIAKQLKDKYDKIQHSKEELIEKLQHSEKDNRRLNNEIKIAQESQVNLQIRMEDLRKNSTTKLLEQEVKTKEILDENTWLKIKMAELEKDKNEKLIEKQKEIDRLQKERLLEIKNELKNRENRAGDVQRLIVERSELVAKIEELRSSLIDRQAREESLEKKILQLQEEIQNEKQHLKKKTERLEETNKELESIRKNSNDLEDQVKTLRKNIENFDDLHKNLIKDHENQMKLAQEEIQALQNEKLQLTTELTNVKDALLIKTKIIEDQQETIRQLREKGDEVKTLLKRNQSLERVLALERDEKLELQEAVERLKWRKEELKGRIKSLESDLLLAPQEVVRDLQKTQMVLHELEHQVQTKQKEWELHLQALIREKEQACSVAEFATKKLMQTTTEFQKQSEAQKRLHRVLAENLAEKERYLREANEKSESKTGSLQGL